MRHVVIGRSQYRFGQRRRVYEGRLLAGEAPYRSTLPLGGVGVGIAPMSEVRAVWIRLWDQWRPLVEGSPIMLHTEREGLDGQLELDRLDWTDGKLVLQIAERRSELPELSRHVAEQTRVVLEGDLEDGERVHLQRPRLGGARVSVALEASGAATGELSVHELLEEERRGGGRLTAPIGAPSPLALPLTRATSLRVVRLTLSEPSRLTGSLVVGV